MILVYNIIPRSHQYTIHTLYISYDNKHAFYTLYYTVTHIHIHVHTIYAVY